MINLNHFGFGDFYENQLSEDDKNNFNIARVIAEHKNAFVLKCEEKDCRAVISGKFFHNIEKSADLPVVGDWVLVRKDAEDPLIIEKILKRKTMLSRKTPADRKTFGNDKEQVLVSNVDVIFIATSLNQNFSLSRIERALVLVYKSAATPVILLSKADLCDSVEEKVESVKRIAFGVPVIAFSSFELSGIDEIVSFINPALFDGLFGVFNDSLPDGWGRLLLDRKLREQGLNPDTLNPLDRLAFIGNNALGALSYEPDNSLRETLNLTRDVREVEKMFKLAVFNVLAHNQDDHAKNFSFLMNEKGEWQTSPAYDLTFSTGVGNEQSMMILGKGKNIGVTDLLELGKFTALKPAEIKVIIDKVQSAVSKWNEFADICFIFVFNSFIVDVWS